MSEWYYAKGGTQSGPVSLDQLKEIARNGGIGATDLVWTSSMKDWQPADQVEGLLTQTLVTGQPAADPSNPYAAPQSAWQEPAPTTGGTLEEIIPGSDPIDVGACVKRGFDLTKRNFGTIFLVGLTYFVVTIVASMVIGMIAGATTSTSSQNANQGVVIITQILLQVLSIYLSLGLVRIGLNLVSGKQVSVGQLFGEGRKLLPAIGASILFGIMFAVGLLLFIIPGIYIALRYGQFMNAMVDRNLGVMDSLTYSSSITTNNRLNLFLLGLLTIAIFIAGFLALVVGLIFAYPVIWLSWMVAYRCMQYGHRAAEDHPGTTTPLLNGV